MTSGPVGCAILTPVAGKVSKYFSNFIIMILGILAGGITTSLMAKKLGLHYSAVRDWVEEYEKEGLNAFPGSSTLQES